MEIPDWILNVFVTADDISPEEHVNMQAAFQKYVDNSISKTINMPESSTVQDVDNAFRLAHEKIVNRLQYIEIIVGNIKC